jgi:hypothetical protein
MVSKKEIKEYISEQIKFNAKSSWFINRYSARIETICRAVVNRLSYTLYCDDEQTGQDSIYLKRDDRIIFIERNPSPNNRSVIGPDYMLVMKKVLEFIDLAKVHFFDAEREQ